MQIWSVTFRNDAGQANFIVAADNISEAVVESIAVSKSPVKMEDVTQAKRMGNVANIEDESTPTGETP